MKFSCMTKYCYVMTKVLPTDDPSFCLGNDENWQLTKPLVGKGINTAHIVQIPIFFSPSVKYHIILNILSFLILTFNLNFKYLVFL